MSIKRALPALIVLLMTLSLLAGCAPAATPTSEPQAADIPTEMPVVEPTAAPLTITDALGRTVTFETLPQRIVIAGKATTLLINSLYMFPEASERLVAYEMRMQNGDNFAKVVDPNLSTKMILETNAGPEQISPAKPDLVIMKTAMEEKLGKPLEAIGINVVYVDMETPESFYSDIRNFVAILGDPVRAEEIIAFYQDKVNSISEKVAGLDAASNPTVLLLQYSNKDNEIAFKVPPSAWLQTLMVTETGGDPIWKDAADTSGWAVVTLEQIAAWNPDIIFIVDYSGNAVDVVASLKANSQWMELKSVQNGKLYAFPTDFISWDQPDSRWILGMIWAATKTHPDLFADVKISDEMNSFYKSLYNLDNAVITGQILPLYKGD